MTAATCSHVTCGRRYVPTDTHRHKILYGHAPTPAPTPPAPREHMTSKCHAGKHHLCGGGVLGGYACACGCHDGGDG